MVLFQSIPAITSYRSHPYPFTDNGGIQESHSYMLHMHDISDRICVTSYLMTLPSYTYAVSDIALFQVKHQRCNKIMVNLSLYMYMTIHPGTTTVNASEVPAMRCTKMPPRVVNASYHEVGKVARYSCLHGYIQVGGEATKVCESGNTWMGHDLECKCK